MFKTILTSTVSNFYKSSTSLKCKYDIRYQRFIHRAVVFQNPRNLSKDKTFPSAMSRKYEVLNETSLPVIEHTADEIHMDEKYSILSDEFDGINLERGKNGVFEIEDLVDLLQRENSKNVFVASVPKEINYVEYICVVSGCSKRHLKALAEFVRKVYKKKCYKSDQIPRIEGKDSDEWIALDLGNIALHIFSDKAREVYDLESLWAVGPEYDEKMTQKSDIVDIFENYSSYLKDLKPLE